MRPQASIARVVMACTAALSQTLPPSAMAWPPAARISPATASAAPPKSLTTTRQPRAASRNAWLRPSP
ncbi:hypothetical protein D3C71_2083970 [compost metagenome]